MSVNDLHSFPSIFVTTFHTYIYILVVYLAFVSLNLLYYYRTSYIAKYFADVDSVVIDYVLYILQRVTC